MHTASTELVEVMKRAETLAPDEQLLLIAYLAEKARLGYQTTAPRRQ